MRIIRVVWQEGETEAASPFSVGDGSSFDLHHEATSTVPACSPRSTEARTAHGQSAPACLDLRGRSFRPSELLMRSNADPSGTATHLPSETSPGGFHLSSSCATAAGSLEQLPSFPSTAATVVHFLRSGDTTSTYSCLENAMVTEAAATAAATSTTVHSAEGGTTTQLDVSLMISQGDDSTVWTTRDFGSEVFLLKFQIIASPPQPAPVALLVVSRYSLPGYGDRRVWV